MTAVALHSPFLWGNDFHDPGLHSVFVDFVDIFLEAPKLLHCLHHSIVSTHYAHSCSSAELLSAQLFARFPNAPKGDDVPA